MGLTNAISQAVQLQLTAGEHILAGTPSASATKALLRLGNAIVGGNAAGTYIGANCPSGYTGDFIFFQNNGGSGQFVVRSIGDGSVRVGIGVVPPGGTARFQVLGDGDNSTAGSADFRNINDGTSAFTACNFSSGTADPASGFFGVYHGGYGSALLANRLVIATNSDATGITQWVNTAGQDFRWVMNTGAGTAEQMRFDSAANLLIGTTTALARLAVVGRGDQVQLRVDAFSTQSSNIIDVKNSVGGSIFTLANNGNLSGLSTVTALLYVANSNTAAINRFGTAAAIANTLVSINTGATTTIGLAIRGVASQSANLQEWQSSTPTTVASISAAGAFAASSAAFTSTVTCGTIRPGSGNAAVPSISFTTDTDCGLFRQGNNVIGFATGGTQFLLLNATGDLELFRDSSTTNRQTATIESGFVVATDASRTGYLQLRVTDFNGVRTFLRGECDGTNPMIGFLGTAAFRATGWGAPTGTATRTTFDTSTVTLAQLAERTKAIIDDMRVTSGYGLLQA